MRRTALLAAMALVLAAQPAVCQPGADLKQALMREAPAKWQEYRERARRFQGQYTLTSTSHQPTAYRHVRVDKFRQNAKAALFERGRSVVIEGDPAKGTGSQLVWGQNSKYSFELTCDGPGKPWVASELELGNKQPLRKLGRPVHEEVLKLVTQQFRGGLPKPLAEALKEKEFAIEKLAIVEGDSKTLVRLHFEYKTKISGAERTYRGWVTLDRNSYWHITQSAVDLVTPGFCSHYEDRYEFAAVANGFPVIKRSVGKSDGTSQRIGKQVFDLVVEWQIREDDAVPDRHFRLSEYGLPEPGESSDASGPSYFLWFFSAAVGCFSTAGLCAYLKRRGQHPAA